MTATKGTTGVIKVAITGGTVAAMGEVRTFSISESADTIETSVMGQTARTYAASLTSATISTEVYWDDADAAQLIMDASVGIIFEWHPTGTGSGEKYYSGAAIVTSKEISVSFDGMVEGSFEAQVTGAVTEATT
jgi:predicted secreted protein